MGSAYTTIAADVVARFQRLRGRRVTLVTGTDEHGEKIALAAAAKGQAPQQHCDGVVAAFQDLWRLVWSPAAAWCVVCTMASWPRPSTTSAPGTRTHGSTLCCCAAPRLSCYHIHSDG